MGRLYINLHEWLMFMANVAKWMVSKCTMTWILLVIVEGYVLSQCVNQPTSVFPSRLIHADVGKDVRENIGVNDGELEAVWSPVVKPDICSSPGRLI